METEYRGNKTATAMSVTQEAIGLTAFYLRMIHQDQMSQGTPPEEHIISGEVANAAIDTAVGWVFQYPNPETVADKIQQNGTSSIKAVSAIMSDQARALETAAEIGGAAGDFIFATQTSQESTKIPQMLADTDPAQISQDQILATINSLIAVTNNPENGNSRDTLPTEAIVFEESRKNTNRTAEKIATIIVKRLGKLGRVEALSFSGIRDIDRALANNLHRLNLTPQINGRGFSTEQILKALISKYTGEANAGEIEKAVKSRLKGSE